MAKGKTPSVQQLLRSKKARDQLTLPQLVHLYEQVKQMAAGTGARATIESNPADFAHRISKGQWKQADHLRLLSDYVAKLEKREIRKLMVSMPPRHGKSMFLDIWTPTWWMARDPTARIIIAGYGQHFAREWGGKVRNKMLEHADELNVVLDKERMAADSWATTMGGEVYSLGVGGSIVGRGADLYIVDDPIKSAEEANSEVYRDKMWDWWYTSVVTRMQPGGCIILIATRWHQDDLLGRLLQSEEIKDWTVVNIPAEAEKDDVLGRSPGEWLWPEYWAENGDPDYYEKTKSTMLPYWWSAQFQGRPTPEGGGILLRDDWEWYRQSDLPEDPDQIVQSWDLPLKDKRTSDYAAGQVWLRKGVNMYLVDLIRDHFPPDQVIAQMQNFAIKYKAVGKLIEDSAMGPTLVQTFQKHVPGMIPVPPKGSKMSRVLNAVPYLKGHNIYLPMSDDGSKSKRVLDFVEECAAFDKGTYDDQVDAFTQAVIFLQPGLWRGVKQAAEDAEQEEANARMKDPDFLRKQRAQWFSQKVVKPALQKSAKAHNRVHAGPRKMW
jgi:predicted phage terminase large subunit-like protein